MHSRLVLAVLLMAAVLCSAQDPSQYRIAQDGTLNLVYYSETPYVSRVPDQPFILTRYINKLIYQILNQINLNKDPPYSDDIYGRVREMWNGTRPYSSFLADLVDDGQYRTKFLENFLGFVIVGAGLLLLGVAVPIAGLVVLGCRCCCNRCRAHYTLHSDEDDAAAASCDSCARKFLSFGLIICTSVVLVCAGAVALVTCDMRGNLDQLQRSYDDANTDLDTYSTNLQQGLEYAAGAQFSNLYSVVVTENLESMQETLGADIQRVYTEENENTRASNLTLLTWQQEVSALVDTMYQLRTDADQLEHLRVKLGEDCGRVKQQLEQTIAECGDRCAGLDSEGIVLDMGDYAFKYQPAEDPIPKYLELQVGQDSVISASKESFDAILTKAVGDTIDTSNRVKELMTNAREKSFPACFDRVVANVSRFRELMPENLLYTPSSVIDTYSQLREPILYGVAAFLVVIPVLVLLAMTCGVCGYDIEATPAQRSAASHCGGLCLILVAIVCFASFLVLTIISVAVFLLAGNLQLMLCSDDLSVPSHFLDSPSAVSGYPGNFIASVVYGDPTNQDLSYADTLKVCKEEDRAGYLAFNLKTIYDVMSCMNYDQLKEDLEAAIEEMSVQIETDGLVPVEDTLEDLLTIYSDASDAAQSSHENYSMTLEAASDIESFSLLAKSYKLRTFAEGMDTSSANTTQAASLLRVKNELEQTAEKLEMIDRLYLSEIKSSRKELIQRFSETSDHIQTVSIEASEKVKSEVDGKEYSVSSDNIREQTRLGRSELNTAMSDDTSRPDNKATEEFKRKLKGYIQSYNDYLATEVKTRVGHCRPLYDAYRSLLVSSCDYVLANYNQLWLMLLVATLTLVPLLLFALKLSNHYVILQCEDSSGGFDKRYPAEGVPLKTVLPIEGDYEQQC